MLISLKHRIALLAMPKTASTSLEAVLAEECDIVLQRPPRLKHTPLRKFERFLRPLLVSVGVGKIETACLFRDPVSWLASWHAYRSRDEIAGTSRSTVGVSFDAFVTAYLSPKPPIFARVGRQSKFISAGGGKLSIDHLYAYENLDTYLRFLEGRFGQRLTLPRLNASGPADKQLSKQTLKQLESDLAKDFAIHKALLAASNT